MLRTTLVRASESERLQRAVSRRGLARRTVDRFIAGERLQDGVAVARELAARGRLVTLDHVGEHVHTLDGARAAARTYLDAIAAIGRDRLPAGVSVKPSQLGLKVAVGPCEELLGDIAAAAHDAGCHVTLDMEDRFVTEATVRLVERMQARGHDHVGCAVQAYLYRSHADVRRLSEVGASLRLCKGAYAEPAHVAHQRAADVDGSFLRCATWLLEHGTYPRIATHDHRLVGAVMETAARLGRRRDEFEFQMLYGVRPDMQDALVRDGYRLRIYVPFGAQWYAYFVRRLAERPANLLFLLRALRGRAPVPQATADHSAAAG
jgi:proline dehydrogenase